MITEEEGLKEENCLSLWDQATRPWIQAKTVFRVVEASNLST